MIVEFESSYLHPTATGSDASLRFGKSGGKSGVGGAALAHTTASRFQRQGGDAPSGQKT